MKYIYASNQNGSLSLLNFKAALLSWFSKSFLNCQILTEYCSDIIISIETD